MILRQRHNAGFERRGDRVEICLSDDERELVADLAEQFRSVLAADRDPDLRRLYPTAYPDDTDRNDDYTVLVHDDLVTARLAAIDSVLATTGNQSIDTGELASWMDMFSGLRLLVGTRLDVCEVDVFDPEDADAPSRALLAWLGYLLEEAVGVAGEFLPVDRSDL